MTEETIRSLLEWCNKSPDDIFDVNGNDLGFAWGIIDMKDVNSLPRLPGIYCVISGNEILYIGKSIDMHQRWKTGHHKSVMFASHSEPDITWIETPGISREQLSWLENYYIKKHNPPYNAGRWK